MSGRNVVVSGIGVVSPLAANARDHYARYRRGESGVVARQADDELAPRWAPAYEPAMSQSIANRMLRKLLQPTAAMAVVAAREALHDAQIGNDADALSSMHLFLASVSFDVPQSQFVPALEASIGSDGTFDMTRFATRGIPQIDPLLIVKSLPNAGLCAIAIEHGVLGPNLNISSGSSGGAQALAMAARAVACGDADVAMAGAYDSLLQPEHIVAERLRGRVAAPGEGAIVWILESEERVRARNVVPYAQVLAAGDSYDSMRRAASEALRESGRKPQIVFGDLLGVSEDDERERELARELLGSSCIVEGATAAIGFTGASSALFSATHAAFSIRESRMRDALIWRSDGGSRNVAFVLAALS